jgi:hypothetical protein
LRRASGEDGGIARCRHLEEPEISGAGAAPTEPRRTVIITKGLNDFQQLIFAF